MSVFSTITTQAIDIFKEQLYLQVQQEKSMLAPYVEMMPFKGENFYFDRLGTAREMRELTGRYEPLTFDDIEFDRRQLRTRTYAITFGVDKKDLEERLSDPSGALAKRAIQAAGITKDRVIIDAMFADVATGRNGGTLVTAAADDVLTVVATGGVTYEDLLTIHQNFIDNDVTTNMQKKLVMGITGDEHTSLMNELELTSGDYTRARNVVDDGVIQKAVGIDLVKFAANVPDPLLPVAGGIRTSFCMTEDAMLLGMVRDWDVQIKDQPGLHDTTTITVVGRIGALRKDGKQIQLVQFTA